VTAGDLSSSAFLRFRQQAERSGRLDAAALKASDAELLAKLKLTEGKYLNRAAILLFHSDPLAFFTGAFVKVFFFVPAAISFITTKSTTTFSGSRNRRWICC
jgi:ATP-dependent DNA helicase RecG